MRIFFDWRIGFAARLHFLALLTESTELAWDRDTSYPRVDMVPIVPAYMDTRRAKRAESGARLVMYYDMHNTIVSLYQIPVSSFFT